MAIDKLKLNYEKVLFLDIETSKVKCDNDEEIQVVYLANVYILDTETYETINSVFFRSIGDTIDYLNEISKKENLICYCHNLDYELYHILREVKGNGVMTDKLDIYNMVMGTSIFRDKNAPLSVFLQEIPCINFRCSYALFNKSVKQLGKDLNLPKLDYDYKVTRTPYSKLTQLDYDYNERDNVIIAKSMIKRWGDRNETLKTTALTFTATTKKDRHEFIQNNFGKSELKTLNMDSANVYDDYDFYRICLESYQGGLTTASKNYFNKRINDKVMSIDITSSYPYQMATKRFPLYDKQFVNHFIGNEAENFYSEILHGLNHLEIARYTQIKGYFATIELINLKIKDDNYLLPLSSSNTIYLEGEVVINGKIVSANKVNMSVDNITLDWINKCYTYDDIIVSELITTTKDRYLRKGEISFILNNFRIKQTMKGVKGKELEYALAKININNMYGVKVQKPLKDRYDIIEGEVTKMEYQDIENFELTSEEIYDNFISLKQDNVFKNMVGKNFDIFTDGIYVTSYARLMLLEMMIELTEIKCICVYTDTDSLKFICNNCKKAQLFIDEINGRIISENNKLYRFEEFKIEFNVSKKDYIEICKLGTWDIENDFSDNGEVILYKYFKTMGAKKYAYISDDGIHTTIAGCSKKVCDTITKYCLVNNLPLDEGLDELFQVGTMFDKSCSGRTVSLRETRDYEYVNTFRYKGKSLLSNGGVIIEETTYTLNISVSDEDVLEMNRESDIIRILNSKGELIYV